ncbi:sensor histidine kinase [Luteolibacter rhizosphaerae]|nr:HAMP domain-containing sensor histidine kinase [Luteolibacter rhizosphaerae]
MLGVAALVLWGGERLARRNVEERVPADRGRLFDFSESMRVELERLESLYTGHLGSIASFAPYDRQDLLAKRCENVVGVRRCEVFLSGQKRFEAEGMKPPVGQGYLVPQLVVEGEGGRMSSRNTVVIRREVFESSHESSGWIPAPDNRHRVYWKCVSPGELVFEVIDQAEVDSRLHEHFEFWRRLPFSPLSDAGEMVAVEGPGRREWATTLAGQRTGPAALVIPLRSALGEWQILAWDRLSTRASYDAGTLAAACGIAGVLVLTGALLLAQQRNAIRLAEERVSFVNRVSHELGTPLTNILLNLDLASRSMELCPVESRRRLGLVHEEVQRLGRLVSNVLTFSRGERKTLELRNTPAIPDEVIAGVLEQFLPSLDRRKVKVDWQRGAGIHTRLDPDALAQITGNLISNVEKYASGGGWIGLETKMDKDRLRLRVSDQGPGIPPAQRERIFEAFERVHRGVSEGSSGTGLGLAIARDLARRMGGDLVLVPVSRGSAFELDLPAAPHLSLVSSNESVA